MCYFALRPLKKFDRKFDSRVFKKIGRGDIATNFWTPNAITTNTIAHNTNKPNDVSPKSRYVIILRNKPNPAPPMDFIKVFVRASKTSRARNNGFASEQRLVKKVHYVILI